MRKLFVTSCCFVAAMLTCVSAQADIVAVGSIIEEGSTPRTGGVTGTIIDTEVNQWSDTTFAKTLDIDGDNRYGTDGVFLPNTTAQDAGAGSAVSFEREGTITGAIAAAGTNNISGNFQNNGGTTGFIQNDANDATLRLGYVGINNGTQGEAIPLTDLFTYTLTADQAAGEILRLGVFGGSNNGDPRLGFTELGVNAAGDLVTVSDPRDTNTGNAPDLYFFDIENLVAGDTIVISAANSNLLGNNFNAATIGGVTLDTIVVAVPEPSSLALLVFGGLGFMIRRRK